MVDSSRHNTIVVSGGHAVVVDGGEHRHDGSTVVMGKRHSDRIVVVGDDRRYRDTDTYYRYANREAEFGRPIYFGQGAEDFNRI